MDSHHRSACSAPHWPTWAWWSRRRRQQRRLSMAVPVGRIAHDDAIAAHTRGISMCRRHHHWRRRQSPHMRRVSASNVPARRPHCRQAPYSIQARASAGRKSEWRCFARPPTATTPMREAHRRSQVWRICVRDTTIITHKQIKWCVWVLYIFTILMGNFENI